MKRKRWWGTLPPGGSGTAPPPRRRTSFDRWRGATATARIDYDYDYDYDNDNDSDNDSDVDCEREFDTRSCKEVGWCQRTTESSRSSNSTSTRWPGRLRSPSRRRASGTRSCRTKQCAHPSAPSSRSRKDCLTKAPACDGSTLPNPTTHSTRRSQRWIWRPHSVCSTRLKPPASRNSACASERCSTRSARDIPFGVAVVVAVVVAVGTLTRLSRIP